jgi:hypothetical protein
MGMSRLEGLFAGLGLTVGVGLAWVYFDRPISTGRQVQGTIVQCRGFAGNAPRWCLVKTDDGHSIPVTLPRGRPHDTITLNVSRRRISKELLYDPDLSGTHSP